MARVGDLDSVVGTLRGKVEFEVSEEGREDERGAALADLDIPELHYQDIERTTPLAPDRSIFDQMKEREFLLCFPYDSFDQTVGSGTILPRARFDNGTGAINP